MLYKVPVELNTVDGKGTIRQVCVKAETKEQAKEEALRLNGLKGAPWETVGEPKEVR